MIGVVMNLGFTPEHIVDPCGTGLYVVAELVPLAIAGPVLHHAWLAANLFPTVVTGQAQGIAMTGHHAIDIAETAYRIAVAVDHFVKLVALISVSVPSAVRVKCRKWPSAFSMRCSGTGMLSSATSPK
ncbi:hypothetical protein D3C84_689240 [compost metagenome]